MCVPLGLLLQVCLEHLHADDGRGLDLEIVDTISSFLASLLVEIDSDAVLSTRE